jgi:hypothetical protein
LSARLGYARRSTWAVSLRGRKNLPVGSSISSSAGAPAIHDDTASPSRIDALNARSLAEERIVRQVAQCGPRYFDDLARLFPLVGGQIIDDDDVARPERWNHLPRLCGGDRRMTRRRSSRPVKTNESAPETGALSKFIGAQAATLVGLTSRRLLELVIGIARGFIASGISRTRSTFRSPFSRLALLT